MITDLPIYQNWAESALKGLTPYCDFWLPSPPLSIPFINHPAHLGRLSYPDAFKLEMLVMDAVCFAGLWLFLKHRTAATERTRSLALCLYSALGVALPHLMH